MKQRLLLVTGCILFLFSNSGAEIYLWPTHGLRRMSSSFGEFREGHFHAGIDIRSFGRIGMPCLAVGDGEVRRVRISPTGYGKALYLKLGGGQTAVYAHLQGFTRSIDSLTYYWRLERGLSWCDLTLGEGEYTFTVGDTVAFTGDTGTKSPHLHFELRDGRQRPFNPLEELYSVPDEYAPVISGLEVVPLSEASVVEGRPFAVTAMFRASGKELYTIDDTLQLEGVFGFGACLWDEQGFGSYRMAPLRTELFIDGRLLYRVVNSRFDYSQTGQIVLEYDLLGAGPAGRYVLLFRKPGSTLENREGAGFIHTDENVSGGLLLEPGLHRGEIVAVDASGNESRAVFHFAIHAYPRVKLMKKLSAASEVVVNSVDPDEGAVEESLHESLDGGASWRSIFLEPFGKYSRGDVSHYGETVYRYVARDGYGAHVERYFSNPDPAREADGVFCECRPVVLSGGIILRISTDRILSFLPVVERLGEGTGVRGRVFPLGPREHAARFAMRELDDGINVFCVSGVDYRGYPLVCVSAFRILELADTHSAVFFLSDTLKIGISGRPLDGPVPCLVREVPSPGEPPAGARASYPSFRIDFPEDRFIKAPQIDCMPGEKTGLFRWGDEKGKWECVGVPAMEKGKVTVSRSGVYTFMEDHLPPDVRHVAVEDQPITSGFFKPYVLSLPVIEDGCGVDPYSAEAFLGGRKVVCEWDEFRERVLIPVPASWPAGRISLDVELCDRAGNRSVGAFSFVIE